MCQLMSIGLLSYWDPKLTTVLHSQQCLFSVWRTPFEYLVAVKSPRPNSLSLVWLFFLPHFDVVAATIFSHLQLLQQPWMAATSPKSGQVSNIINATSSATTTTAITTTTTTISNGHYQPKYNSKWNFTHSLLINRLISLSSLHLAIHCSICSCRAGFLSLWVWICARMELQCMSQLLADFKKQNICLLLLNWDSQWFCCCKEPHASRPKGPHISYRLAYDNRLSICLSDNPFVFLILASVCFYFSVCGSLSPWLCWRFFCTMGYSTTFANGPRVLIIHRNHSLSQQNIHWIQFRIWILYGMKSRSS